LKVIKGINGVERVKKISNLSHHHKIWNSRGITNFLNQLLSKVRKSKIRILIN